MSGATIYRVTRQGLQAIARPAQLQHGPDAFDFETLELARFAWLLHKKPKPRVKFVKPQER